MLAHHCASDMLYGLASTIAEREAPARRAWRQKLPSGALTIAMRHPRKAVGHPAGCPASASLRQWMPALRRLAIDHAPFTFPERSFERSEARGPVWTGLPTASAIRLAFAEKSAEISMWHHRLPQTRATQDRHFFEMHFLGKLLFHSFLA